MVGSGEKISREEREANENFGLLGLGRFRFGPCGSLMVHIFLYFNHYSNQFLYFLIEKLFMQMQNVGYVF